MSDIWDAVQYQTLSMPPGHPDVWVEPRYYEAWQNQSTALMPIWPTQEVYGDIANMPYATLQLTLDIHFEADATAPTGATVLRLKTSSRHRIRLKGGD
jgi:hypothetical protein